MTIIRLIPNVGETALTANTSVSNATLIRVINTGAAAQANLMFANGTVYANVTIANTFDIIIEKASTDLISGANMKAVAIAHRY